MDKKDIHKMQNKMDTKDIHKVRPFTEIWQDFSQSTGFHGFNKLSSGSKVRCCIWCCALIVSTVYLIITVVKELQSYYSYPTLTSVEVESHLEIEFPSVTICNLNSINKAAMTNDTRTDNYYISTGPREIYFLSKDFNWTDLFYQQEGFFANRTVTDILKESKSLYQGFLNIAMFDQIPVGHTKEAQMDYFSVTLTQNGPCLTSNINKTLTTSKTGSGFNLLVWLNVQSDNSYFSTWLGEGIKFIVHDKKEDPFFYGSSGYYVEPGHEIYASVKKYKYHHLPHPYLSMANSYCRDNGQDDQHEYVFTQCWKDCYARLLYNICNCIDFNYQDYTICSKYTYFICVLPRKGDMHTKLKKLCDCPIACHSTRYEVTLSSSIFPSNFYNDLLYSNIGELPRDYFRKNYVSLHIYFDQMETTVVKQVPKYSSSAEIFGNLGGQMGLFLGASILTLMECGEFLVFLLWYIFQRRNNVETATPEKD